MPRRNTDELGYHRTPYLHRAYLVTGMPLADESMRGRFRKGGRKYALQHPLERGKHLRFAVLRNPVLICKVLAIEV